MGGTTAKSCLIERRRAGADQHVRGRPHLPLQEGLGLPGVGAVGRPRRDRRRRRQPRRASTSSACSRSAPSRPAPTPVRRATAAAAREPAVTDADLAARPARRRLLPRRRHAARRIAADRTPCAAASPTSSGSTVGDTAAGMHEVVNQNMAAAARMHAVEQGVDLRGVPLLAFGGAGPVHACGVAELLESSRVVFPVNASVLSAFGTLVSPVRIDLARSMVRALDSIDRARARRRARRPARRGTSRVAGCGRARRRRALPLRRRRPLHRPGQRDHVWLGDGRTVAGHDGEVRRPLRVDYRRIYGLTIPDVGIEAVTWRLSAVSAAAVFEPTPFPRVAVPRRPVAGRSCS